MYFKRINGNSCTRLCIHPLQNQEAVMQCQFKAHWFMLFGFGSPRVSWTDLMNGMALVCQMQIVEKPRHPIHQVRVANFEIDLLCYHIVPTSRNVILPVVLCMSTSS